MRLLDRILSEGYISNDPKISDRRTVENLKKAQLVVIDNVAAYCDTELEVRGKKSLDASDFPNVMLPFDFAFFEMRLPSSLNLSNVLEAVGVLMEMSGGAQFRTDMETNGELKGRKSLSEDHPFFDKEVPYYLTCYMFARDRHSRKNFHYANFCVPVNKDGQIYNRADETKLPWVGGLNQSFLLVPEGALDQKTEMSILFERFLYPAFLSISFMHCRNVKVTEEKPPEKLSKKHQKTTGRSLLKYRMLHIDHMKQVLEHEGGAGTKGLKAALHICRGHFKHYGKDGSGLLFGKHAGMVWFSMHTRGTKEAGIVVKDYDVK